MLSKEASYPGKATLNTCLPDTSGLGDRLIDELGVIEAESDGVTLGDNEAVGLDEAEGEMLEVVPSR